MTTDTPMGTMTTENESDATVLLEIGEPVADGWSVTGTYEALELRTSGDMGGGTVSGEEIVGKPFTGVLARSGGISITDAPETPGQMSESLDPGALFVDLLVPLPPVGTPPDGSWPVSSTVVSAAAITMTMVFEGTARFAGDTVWNGIPAQVIVADGTLEVEGWGEPAGVPAELGILFSGESTRRYVWDPAQRIMLAALTTSEAGGGIEMIGMDMSMPADMTSRQEVTLQR
jgi:hypothetical protein